MNRRNRELPRVVALVLACVYMLAPVPTAGQIRMTDVTRETGVSFRHDDGSSGCRYIMETVCAGLALFDYDGDGDVDVYFLNGARLPAENSQKLPESDPPRNALYRNDGNWKFTDVTQEAGVGDRGFGLGVVAGDYDNDGDQDLYLNNHGPNVLYCNNGDGTFTDVTAEAGVGNGDRTGAGTCFLDCDADGYLDLYVSNYLKFSTDRHAIKTYKGVATYVGPTHYPADPDTLYRNNRDGTFTDVSGPSGIAARAGWGMGIVSADYDNDGDSDMFVANDLCENFLFQNDGTGKFEEVGLLSGAGYDAFGREQGSMGVDCGDYDNDGWLDFYQTSYQRQQATLYRNLGDGGLEDVTSATGTSVGTVPNVTWGLGMVDFDNDGDRDLFISCGHLQDQIELYDDTSTYHQKNILLMNTGAGKFVDVAAGAGDGLAVELSSRGAGFDDLDGDGDVDVVVLNSRSEPTILRNDTAPGNHWIDVRLRGTKASRDGVGAHVKVVAGELTQMDEVHSGRGYQSDYGRRLHFGLRKHSRVDRIEVRWIGRGVDVVENVPVDRTILIIEGTSGAPAQNLR